MSSTERFYAATCQVDNPNPTSRDEISKAVDKMLEMVDYDGRILAQAESGTGDKIVVGPIDLAALRAERKRRRGHNMLSHLRMQTYPCYSKPIYPAGGGDNGKITIQSNETAINQGHQAFEKMSRGRP